MSSQQRKFKDSPPIPPDKWIQEKIKQSYDKIEIVLPLKMDGSEYECNKLYQDQKTIFATVMKTLHDWITLEDKTKFKPLRMILNGSGGTGKSVLINTLVTAMRKMFNDNGIVHITAPTGAAAFNVNGETIHHFLEIKPNDPDYVPGTMSGDMKQRLLNKLNHCVALIIDERSLLSSNLFGNAEQKMKETIFGGLLPDIEWGGLPILILVGDDYQLPPVKKEGGLEVLLPNTRETRFSKATVNGKIQMKACAQFVMELKRSRRLKDSREKDRQLLHRFRLCYNLPGVPEETIESMMTADIEKLLSLHLTEIEHLHGPEVVREIEQKSIYLYYRNEPHIKRNMECPAHCCSESNPVAFCRVQSSGTHGKSIAGHFREESPETAMLCIGAKVCLEGRNFSPTWGLHNGACGFVQEIVFQKGKNPNDKYLPDYVVVDFPQYCGPIWDIEHPTVSNVYYSLFLRISFSSN